MLDDISWLRGYLARRLTVGRTGLYVAENTLKYTMLLLLIQFLTMVQKPFLLK